MIKSYLLENWTMLLVLAAFAIALHITVFLNKQSYYEESGRDRRKARADL